MNNEELLGAVINKYKLDEPVPAGVRRSMEQSRNDNLVKILKQDAQHALFISAVVSFFLWIKKFGVSVSIVKSAAAVTAAIAIGAGAITAAGVYGTVKITGYLHGTNKDATGTVLTVAREEKVSAGPEVITYSLAVSQVEMDDAAGNVLSGYTDTVIKELRRSSGPRAAVNFDMLDSFHKADRILSVSIIKLDEKSHSVFRISAKIISSTNSQVLKHVSETVSREDEIPDALRILAVKVSAGL
ncbi:MAG TPA: hypothetical protein PK514_03220 [Spirochaetota bacterium]|nr:hypothetical protein [Spirochaetota bacterium]